MIKKIITKGFKSNLNINQEIGFYTLFTGPMGSGKSAHLQALCLAILGYLPADQKRKAQDIFDTHSYMGQDFSVGFEVEDGLTFGHKWKKNPKTGAVSTTVFCDGKTLKKEEIGLALEKCGAPAIFDLSVFVGLSDQKKVDYLFELFPPAGDVAKITEDIEGLQDREKRLVADMRGKRAVVEQLTGEKAAIEIPAGTLPEVQAEIEAKEKELSGLRKDLHREEIRVEKEKTEKEIEERLEREAAQKNFDDEAAAAEKAKVEPEPPADNVPVAQDSGGQPSREANGVAGDGRIELEGGGVIPSKGTREQIAKLAHDQWSGWMEYLFRLSIQNNNGSVTIPKSLVDRWKKQIDIPYHLLSDKEQDSDRKEADKFLKIFYG